MKSLFSEEEIYLSLVRLSVLNKYIKNKKCPISKSNFYSLKQHLLYYLMETGLERDILEVRTCGTERIVHSGGNQYVVRLEISMKKPGYNNQTFQFHQEIGETNNVQQKKLRELLNIDQNSEVVDYVAPEIIEMDDCDVDTCITSWMALLGMCERNNWVIYKNLSTYDWRNTITKRYIHLHMKPLHEMMASGGWLMWDDKGNKYNANITALRMQFVDALNSRGFDVLLNLGFKKGTTLNQMQIDYAQDVFSVKNLFGTNVKTQY